MKWLLSSLIFSAVLTGFNTPALATKPADKAPPAEAPATQESHHDDHGTGHESKLSVGVKQPDIVREKAILPGKVVLSEPAPLAKVPAGTITLKWKPASGATVHHIQVATDPRFKWMVIENANVSGDSFEVSNLQAGQQYFWRVAGRSPDNDAAWTHGYFTSSSFEVK